jgi:hypothetical protein
MAYRRYDVENLYKPIGKMRFFKFINNIGRFLPNIKIKITVEPAVWLGWETIVMESEHGGIGDLGF